MDLIVIAAVSFCVPIYCINFVLSDAYGNMHKTILQINNSAYFRINKCLSLRDSGTFSYAKRDVPETSGSSDIHLFDLKLSSANLFFVKL